jgi:hypothetical protein
MSCVTRSLDPGKTLISDQAWINNQSPTFDIWSTVSVMKLNINRSGSASI